MKENIGENLVVVGWLADQTQTQDPEQQIIAPTCMFILIILSILFALFSIFYSLTSRLTVYVPYFADHASF